ncbi:uncharacterized protein DUF4349 [Chitinophaga niastensis]|uniref:Uncharacterized protein DUF4349 n=2 Tax=Chitinophaga niastensis TaxID=536980 RepID=A0A2P8HF04_CHINA|nr:uncharacterized protein DUF4349 [Chitinophaga niastensis]
MEDYVKTADSTTFSNDISSLTSASRKRIKSADVRCRVTNVFAATSRLEQIVNEMGGVVAESSLKNEFVQQHELLYTSDSVKRVQLYTPTANLTLKVPVMYLDTVVRSLTAMAGFIDYRIIRDQDLTLKYLSNALKNENEKKAAEKIVPEKKGKPLDVAVYQHQQEDQVVDRKMVNLEILDDVAYSTFTVQLFQPEVVDVQVVVNPAQATRAGFGTEIIMAMRSGAELLRNILLFFIQIWPFVLALALGWLGYKKLLARKG